MNTIQDTLTPLQLEMVWVLYLNNGSTRKEIGECECFAHESEKNIDTALSCLLKNRVINKRNHDDKIKESGAFVATYFWCTDIGYKIADNLNETTYSIESILGLPKK